jgi:outer membrane receptor protein involved in Fe transport
MIQKPVAPFAQARPTFTLSITTYTAHHALTYRAGISASIVYLVILFFTALPVANQASAEPTDLSSPNEITITADPYERSVQEISSSVSVVPSSQLQNQGSQQLSQSLSLVPNINTAGGTNTARFFQIRGIGELEQYEGAPNYSVGFFLDDIDLSGIGGVSMFDISSLEVLRGPQATAYGANALAGIIHLSSGSLSDNTPGIARFSFGSDNLNNAGVAMQASSNDGNTRARMSLFQERQDGFRSNEYLGKDDTNGRDTAQGIFKVQHDFSSDASLGLNLLSINTNNGYDAFAIDNSYHTQSDRPGNDNLNVLGASARYTQVLSPEWKLSSVTSYTGAKSDYGFDGDWGNNPFWNPYAPYDYSYESNRSRDALWQDIRFTDNNTNHTIGKDSRYLLAGYIHRFFEDSNNKSLQDGAAYDSLESSYRSTTAALYGERETPLITDTSLTTGIRLERKEASYNDSRQTAERPTDTMLGGSVSLNHKLASNTTSYALVSRGFRAGGVNTGLNIPDTRRVFDDESLWNYELGLKSYLKSIKTASNISLFHQQTRNSQVKGSYQLDPQDPLTFTYITDNAASGFSQGIEWELTSQISDRLSLVSQVSLLQTELDANTAGLLQDRARSHAPAWSYSVMPKYFLTDALYTGVQVTGMGSFYFDDSFNKRSSPYSLVNAEIGYQKDTYSLSFWARNIFDKEYSVRGFYFGVEPPDYPAKLYKQLGDPFSCGATLTVYF